MTILPLKRQIVIDQVLMTLSNWWETGYTDLDYTYKGLINYLFPAHTFGNAHAKFIGEACILWEEKYGVEIDNILPNLRERASHWKSTLS
jgi:hypothetical protein